MKRLGAANAMCGVASLDTCGLPSSLTSPATGPRVAVAVVAGGGIADIALDDQVADRDLGVVDVGEDLADGREHAARDVIDEGVRPHVARGVGQVPVGEGEHLALFVGAVGRVPCAAHASSSMCPSHLPVCSGWITDWPYAMSGNPSGPTTPALKYARLALQRGHDLRADRVLASVDRDVTVVGDILPRPAAGLDGAERLEGLGGGSAERHREHGERARGEPTVAGDRRDELTNGTPWGGRG